MCLSVPAEVLEIDGMRAKVSVGGAVYSAGLHLVEDVRVGDYLLIHSGYAIQKIDAQEAEETLSILREAALKVAEEDAKLSEAAEHS
jgi:hydrogenase expression/formation protein HypC